MMTREKIEVLLRQAQRPAATSWSAISATGSQWRQASAPGASGNADELLSDAQPRIVVQLWPTRPRILQDICHLLPQLRLVPNHSVKVLRLPDSAHTPVRPAKFMCRKRLPAMNEPLQKPAADGRNDRMHVIVHDHRSTQLVSLAVEVPQAICNDRPLGTGQVRLVTLQAPGDEVCRIDHTPVRQIPAIEVDRRALHRSQGLSKNLRQAQRPAATSLARLGQEVVAQGFCAWHNLR